MKTDPPIIPKNLESRVQDIIYNVDVGMGSQMVKVGLYVFMVFILMAMYWLSEFWGLKHTESMDQAQIARQLMNGEGFTTKYIRPAATWMLEQHGSDPRTIMLQQPDLVHPPIYPWLLSKAYGFIGGSFTPGQKVRAYPPEQWAIVPLGNLCTMLTGLFLFLIARRFFERRIALVATTLFFVTDRVWATGISGLSIPLAGLLAIISVYLGFIAIDKIKAGQAPRRWLVPFTLTALTCALTFLTRYSAGWMLVAILLTMAFMIPERGWKLALAMLGLIAVFVSPWIMRNMMVCGNPFGLTPYLALNVDLPSFPQSFERQVTPATSGAGKLLQTKWAANVSKFYDHALASTGNGILAALFITAFFFRFSREHMQTLRFGLLAAMTGMFLVACFFGEPSMRTMSIFWPFIILYGLSFFYLLVDRMQITVPVIRGALIGLMVAMTALPLVITLSPPRSGFPYPPYYPSYIALVTNMMDKDELLGTDMPWATAWYGDRSSVLVPASLEEFYRINDLQKRISALYFTTLTRDLPYVSGLATGPFSSWYPIFREMIPMDFPLTEAFFISNKDQLFLTDRPRWTQPN